MSLRKLKDIRKTIGFRMTVWYTGILVLSMLILFAIIYLVLSSTLKTTDRQAIEMKLRELSSIYQNEGQEALEREVNYEKKFEKRTPFLIRLAGPENKILFLKIPYQWAEFDIHSLEIEPADSTIRWLQMPKANKNTALEVASIRLANNYLLQVGKSTDDRENILRHFRQLFIVVMIPLLLLGFVGGSFLSYKALQPIRHLINTIRSIDTGKMDARAPSLKTDNDLEELVALFNGMVERIANLIKSMRESLDNVAHDLRTPLTRLRVVAEMALRSDHSLREYREALADCVEESERILTMLNQLMDISEAETGMMKMELKSAAILELIEEVVDIYRYIADEKDIAIHVGINNGLYTRVDPSRMRQVIGNLLDNAIKYTPKGGRIDVEARLNAKNIAVLIKDTGVGMPPEELPRIWERLYRCDQSRSQSGLGLGLSLVKAIVGAHHGRIDVASTPGKGSTFTIYLPIVNSPPF